MSIKYLFIYYEAKIRRKYVSLRIIYMKRNDIANNKKNIVFLMMRFLDGGIDTVLVEYLRYLAQDEHYHITLGIALYMGSLEVFINRLPKNIEVIYFCRGKGLTHIPQKKIRKKVSISKKMADELLINPIRRYLIRKNINRLAQNADTIIDFDCCASTFLKSVSTKKIAFFHFSFKQSIKQNYKRIKRISKRLENYDQIVTISQAMAKEGRELFPKLKDKITVIYNAKDPDFIQKQAALMPDEELIHRPYLLAVERLEESQKDLSNLLRAYAILKQKYKIKEALYIIGKGNSQKDLIVLTKQLNIVKQVVFLGFVENPYPWMLHCKILVHSAKFEGLPTVLIEGLMLKKLMVSSDCPTGPREILDDGAAGMLVKPADPQAFAEAVYKLLTNKDLQVQIYKGINKRVQDFTFQNIDKQLKCLL